MDRSLTLERLDEMAAPNGFINADAGEDGLRIEMAQEQAARLACAATAESCGAFLLCLTTGVSGIEPPFSVSVIHEDGRETLSSGSTPTEAYLSLKSNLETK